MRYYFAPMEGITGHNFRSVHHLFFPHVDSYYAPFISPAQSCVMNPKEKRDILPDNNQDIHVIPQILASRAKYFTQAEQVLRDYGYQEVNLNLGCPSKTVVSKKKGAGMLRDTDYLHEFLEDIFSNSSGPISVKTRIGVESPEEFPEILDIFNEYPIKELTIHCRTQNQFYKGQVYKECFSYAYIHSKNPLCYNGDIRTPQDCRAIQEEYPNLQAVMLGRGLLSNPALVEEIKGQTKYCVPEQIKAFHDRLFLEYQKILSGETPLLYKMKEWWFYRLLALSDEDVFRRYTKRMKKVQTLAQYKVLVNEIFETT